MKESLREFFEKTAYRSDAVHYFQLFHTVPSEHFLLLILGPRVWSSHRSSVIEAINYLLKLGLSPTLYIPREYYKPDEYKKIADRLKSLTRKTGGELFFFKDKGSMSEVLIRSQSENPFFKIFMLRELPLVDKNGQWLSRIRLNRQNVDWERPDMVDLHWLSEFLRTSGPARSVQISPPDLLLSELFTARGSGSLVSWGYDFNTLSSSATRRTKLKQLIESGFHKRLKPDYFKSLGANWSVLVESGYQGAIVMIQYRKLIYLDKIVVSPQHWGRGLGSMLLDEVMNQMTRLTENSPGIIWRARHDNAFRQQYAELLDETASRWPCRNGTVVDNKYIYHLLGVPRQLVPQALDFMRKRPDSFVTSV